MEVITTHLNADFDGLASMIAAKKLYPNALMSFSGSQEKPLRDFLNRSAQTYKFERLKNIPLTQIKRLIIVDTRQPSRIGPFAECLKNPGLEIHLYDHHPDAPGDIKGNLEEIRNTGSTATIFTQIFQQKMIPLTEADATLLAMAIYEDTGSFTFDTTTPADLEAVAWLLKIGAELQTVSQFISHELTSHQVTLLHDLIKSATTYTIQGIDIVVSKINVPEYVDEFALIVRRFMTMENLNTLFAVAKMGDRIYLICRSRIPEVNVGEIASDFGGGGHASAASAAIKNITLTQVEEKLIHLLHKHVRPASLARELMSSPVISATPNISINVASQILDRYNVTVLPILQNKKKVLGIISRRVVSKAIFHGLGDLPVSEYMTTEFESLAPNATLADIQELIIEHRQRFIPVIERGIIQGVITRTDLLNLLVNDPGHLPKNMLDSHDQPSTERNRNLNSLIVEHLNRETIILLRTIGEVAHDHGYNAYAVGGFVRDLLLRQKNLDLDIVVESDGIDFAKKLAAKLGGEIRTHEKFNTALVLLPNGGKVDVATARLEYYEYPAAMPTVELSSIKLDLYRRDFTINAMAIHLNPDTFGTLVDFFNCQNDLKDQKIRILHNLSFVEDPTRVFRAIRFEQRMGFKIGKHTERLIKSAVKMDLFDSFPHAIEHKAETENLLDDRTKNSGKSFGYRFYCEIKLILSEEDPLKAIDRMAQFKILKFLHPQLKFDPRLQQILEDTKQAVDWHRLLYLDEPCHQWMVYLLALTARININEFDTFCQHFEVPSRFRQLMLKTKQQVISTSNILKKNPALQPSQLFNLLQDLTIEGLLFLMGMTKEESGKKSVSLYITRLRHIKTHVHGADLKKMGYQTGPLYRTILERLLKARLDNLTKTRQDEIDYLQTNFPLTRD
ncbi:MAG: CBS domain-containing protein [Proteobacteria bacterium]|nr:CBS domain-containing protein [Pseudomonadota bacterium]MBU1717204.1 CBS domain-containing protein [Pseudomonadota bacterium]